MLGLAPHAAEQKASQEDWFYVEIQKPSVDRRGFLKGAAAGAAALVAKPEFASAQQATPRPPGLLSLVLLARCGSQRTFATSPALIESTAEIAAGTRISRSLNRLVRPQRITTAIL